MAGPTCDGVASGYVFAGGLLALQRRARRFSNDELALVLCLKLLTLYIHIVFVCVRLVCLCVCLSLCLCVCLCVLSYSERSFFGCCDIPVCAAPSCSHDTMEAWNDSNRRMLRPSDVLMFFIF